LHLVRGVFVRAGNIGPQRYGHLTDEILTPRLCFACPRFKPVVDACQVIGSCQGKQTVQLDEGFERPLHACKCCFSQCFPGEADRFRCCQGQSPQQGWRIGQGLLSRNGCGQNFFHKALKGTVPVADCQFENGHVKVQVNPVAADSRMILKKLAKQLVAEFDLVLVQHLVSNYMSRASIACGKYGVTATVLVGICSLVRHGVLLRIACHRWNDCMFPTDRLFTPRSRVNGASICRL